MAVIGGQAWQAATLTILARALGQVREAVQPRVGEQSAPLAGERTVMQATLPVTPGEGSWLVVLDAPQGCNYLIVDAMTLSVGGKERDLLAEVP